MPVENQIKNNFLRALSENVKDPFIILDQSGNVITYNGEASNLLSLKYEDQNIYDIIDPVTSEKLKAIIEELVYSESLPLIKEIDFALNNGLKFHTGLVINSVKEDDQFLIPLTFNIEPKKVKFERVTDLGLGSKSLEELIANKNIHDIINEIISFYPFTFIGKEKIRQRVDQLEEYFWIKDTNGIFILVNEKLCKGLGLKQIHIEGKSEDSFTAPYMVDFFNSIENYIKQTSSTVTVGGVPFKDFFSGDEYQTVQLPIIDTENKVIAIIGVSQKILHIKSEIGNFEWISRALNILKNLPKAVAFIDNEGKIKHSSEEFCKLFSEEFRDLDGIDFANIFPIQLADKIKNFLNSAQESEKIELSGSLNLKKDFTGERFLFITRIFDSENKSVGISILIDEAGTGEDLQKIINRRGRMFEVLIQNNPEPIFIYDKENLRFLEVNNAALELYGYRRDEFLQMDLTDLYSPEDIQTLLDSETGPKEGKFQGPYRHKKKNGNTVLVELNKASLTFNERDADFIIVRDVTDKLANDKTNQLFKAAFDNTEDLLFVTDESGFITFINRHVTMALGHTKEELEKTSFAALVEDEERSTVNTSIFQSHLKETVTLDVKLKKSDGEYIPAEITATPVLDYSGNVDSFLVLAKEKHVDVEVQEQPPKEIIKEVIKEVIVEKPVPAPKEKESGFGLAFFSNVFHEILTPINVILGFVQELTESIEEPSPEQKEASDIINQNRNNLLSIMNSVIEYSQIQENAVDIKPQQLVITEIIDQLQIDSKDAVGTSEVEFGFGKISSSLKFESDKQKFLRLLSLLFKIASKLSKQKKIYFSAIPYNEDSLLISFKDSYSSASDALCSNFDKFFENDENFNAKNFGISRLTSQLVKALIELLNGRYENFHDLETKNDCGFIFPLAFEQPQSTIEEKIEQEPEQEEEQLAEEPESVEAKIENPEEEKHEEVKEEKPEEEIQAEQTSETIESETEPIYETHDIEEKSEEPETEEIDSVEEFEEVELKEEKNEEVTEEKAEPEKSESETVEEGNLVQDKTEPEKVEEDNSEPEKAEVEKVEESLEEEAAQTEEVVENESPAEAEVLMEKIEEPEESITAEEETQPEEKEENEITRPENVEETKVVETFSAPKGHLDLSQLSCLYVEDQVDSQILFKVQMKELKEIKFATSLEETLPLLEQHPFDFLVIDINLQGEYNGIDALKIIHKMPQFESIPIIAVTAYVLPGDKEKFIAAGFHDFIAKPIFREKMIESLDKIFVPNN